MMEAENEVTTTAATDQTDLDNNGLGLDVRSGRIHQQVSVV